MYRPHSTTHSPSSLRTRRLCLLDCYQFTSHFHLKPTSAGTPAPTPLPAQGPLLGDLQHSLLSSPSSLSPLYWVSPTCMQTRAVISLTLAKQKTLLSITLTLLTTLLSLPAEILRELAIFALELQSCSLSCLPTEIAQRCIVKSHSWTASLWYLTDQQHLIELVTASFPPFLHLAFGQPCFLEFLFT